MTIQELGSLGELVAAVATVATLVYLAAQIRQNTRTVRASGTGAASVSVNAMTHLLAQDDDARRVYFRGMRDPDSLTDDEREKFFSLVMLYLAGTQQAFYLLNEDAISDRMWSQTAQGLEWAIAQPGFVAYWSVWGGMNSPEFNTWVEERVVRNRRD